MENQRTLTAHLGGRISYAMRAYAPLMILIGLVILFTFISPNFMTPFNIRILIRQVSFVAISAVGLMFVMIGGGIDLSIGSQIILTNIVLSIMMVDWDIPLIIAIGISSGRDYKAGARGTTAKPSSACRAYSGFSCGEGSVRALFFQRGKTGISPLFSQLFCRSSCSVI